MPAPEHLHEFDSIRPYRDEEVTSVVARLIRDPWLIRGVAGLKIPQLHRRWPALARLVVEYRLRYQSRNLHSIGQFQQLMFRFMEKLIQDTIREFSWEGLEDLPTKGPYLYISNHRDIVLDPGLLNVALNIAGHPTCQLAIGDNLFDRRSTSDLMRLNKGFVVRRGVTGNKALYAAMSETSRYIRHSLEGGESVWIAQREGRAKDGIDRTDPAVLKMLGIAYRNEIPNAGALPGRVPIVPVSVSYELDPCDGRKAEELYQRSIQGEYKKAANEDILSIVEGLRGDKGRVHLSFGAPITSEFESPEALAVALDEKIVGNFKIFPTHVDAARQLGRAVEDASCEPAKDVMATFDQHQEALLEAVRPHLLSQYANIFSSREALGLG